ncbi:MAG: hypothetical protein ACOYL3_23315 [Desulfuromonadaceae bacterium]
MNAKSTVTLESNSEQSSEKNVAWSAPKISRLEIQRTMASSGPGTDFGKAST